MNEGDPICIIGAGITGLACALTLSSSHPITIIARDMPGDLGHGWASPWAGAVFHPQHTTHILQQKMQRRSFKFYTALAHSNPESGVQILPMTEYFDDRSDEAGLWYKDLMPNFRPIPNKDLPENCTFGVKYDTLAMNPTSLLPWLRDRLLEKGVSFMRIELKDGFEQARFLSGAKIVINASGNGARELAGDNNVMKVRGQTMFVKTDFNELVMKEGSEYTYVIPRQGSGGVILGGVRSERTDVEVDAELRGDILRRVNRITGGRFEGMEVSGVKDIVGFRPGRRGGLRVEREGDVVHAYGLEGAGYIYSFGVAERVKELVEEGVKAKL